MAKASDSPPGSQKVLGSRVGEKLSLAKKLGKGRLGDVFAGVHPVLARRFAVKLLRADLTLAEVIQDRLRRAIREVSTLDHPYIVSLVDFGAREEDGRFYLTMEFVRGTPLSKILRQQGCLHPERALLLLYRLAEGLEAAHEARTIHGDLKPNNILIVEQTEGSQIPRLTDFMLTQALAPQPSEKDRFAHLRVQSTLEYLPPELIRGQKLDRRTDIYALGAVGYHLFVGEPPFTGSPAEIIKGHKRKEPLLPSKRASTHRPPRQVDSILMRCLQKDPEARFPSVQAILRELRPLLGEMGGVERTTGIMVRRLEQPEPEPLQGQEADHEEGAAEVSSKEAPTPEPVPAKKLPVPTGLTRDLKRAAGRAREKRGREKDSSGREGEETIESLEAGEEAARTDKMRTGPGLPLTSADPSQEGPAEPDPPHLSQPPVRIRQVLYDSVLKVAEGLARLGCADERLTTELRLLQEAREEVRAAAARGATIEARFEDLRREMRERESMLRYAIIDLNLIHSELQVKDKGSVGPADLDFQIHELETSLGRLERDRQERIGALNAEMGRHREGLKALEQRLVLHYRRLYALLDEARGAATDNEILRLYRLVDRCRHSLSEAAGGARGGD